MPGKKDTTSNGNVLYLMETPAVERLTCHEHPLDREKKILDNFKA